MLWWSFLQLFLSLSAISSWRRSLALMLEDFRIPVPRSFFLDCWWNCLFRTLRAFWSFLELLPLSCQKKNISRNFIYYIFLVTFSHLQTDFGRSFNPRISGFLLEKNFPGEGCSVGFRLQFHGFLGVSPRFWLVEDSWRWPAKISSDDSSSKTLSLSHLLQKLLSWWNF